MQIFADSFTRITLANNNIRITLTQNGPDNEQIEAGTLIIPASQASNFVNGLVNSIKDLDEKLKARADTESEDANIQ